jgi:hypothetical protein
LKNRRQLSHAQLLLAAKIAELACMRCAAAALEQY